MRVIHSKIFLTFLVLISMTSCFENPVCAPQGSNLVNINFYDIDSKEEAILDFYAITTTELPAPSMIDPTDTLSASNLALPLNPYEAETEFIFTFENSTETLKLSYETRVDILQNECGFDPIFEDLMLIDYSFDSVVVTHAIINDQIDVNVKIYN